MRITSAGNVGIGTSSPNAKLDVLVASGNRIQIGTSVAGSSGEYVGGLYYTSNKLLIESFLVGTGYQPVLLAPNGGNVGIGISDPTEKLHLYANAAAIELRMQNNTISSYIRSQTDNLNFYISNGEKMRITTGGNVGIGTASPGCRLDIVGGNVALNDNKLLIRFPSDGNHSLEFNSGYNGPFLYGYTGAALGYRGTGVIWTSNTNYFNYGNTTTWNQTSDIRAKQNINTITNAIDKITLLNPVTFDYTDEFASQRSWADKHKLNNVGFIAQEYENVFPDDVNEVEEKIGDVTYEDFKTINTTSIVPYLVKAIQELKAENDTLKEILQRNNIQ
jgi:hypothetical protein